LLQQTGKTVNKIKRADVLWTAIDTNNVMMQRANSLSHYHGTLDGLDVLSAKPEYTDFSEHGRTFVALDREPDPLTPQSWWQIHKWYFYWAGITIVALILTCSLCWVCTCANCCVAKCLFNPCITCCEKSLQFRRNLKIHKKFKRESLTGLDAAARAMLLNSLPTGPRASISITPRIEDVNEIQIMPNQAVLYRPSQQIQDLQSNTSYSQRNSIRSPSEGVRQKPNYSRRK
jgi:hypothetical protein